MKNIFHVKRFQFPYSYQFPGQSSDERILYLARENKLLLRLKQLFVLLAALVLLIAYLILKQALVDLMASGWLKLLDFLAALLLALFLGIGWWWVTTLWKKSIALVTTRRLIKFIYTTPVSRYSLVLPLEMIVDTGSYTRGFIQTFLRLGTFIARSSATSSGVATDDVDRVNKKYFYISNIKRAEDLQHYIGKLLTAFRSQPEELEQYRPFLPELKGQERENFIKNNFPQFWD